MSFPFKKIRAATLGVLTLLAVLAPVGAVPADAAPAVTLRGDWAPFTRCPVDDPAMLAADGKTTIALCLSSDSPNGSIKLGNTTATTGDSNLQFGLAENTTSGATFSFVSPAGGGIVAAPAQVPGGLLGLMCPSDVPLITPICQAATDNDLNNVTATVQPAGEPSNFSLAAGLTTGKPILTLPVKVHLQNPLLGSSCFIGSDADPIVLHPENLTVPTRSIQRFDGDGTPNQTAGVMSRIAFTGGTQGDNSFAVPGATGCGAAGLLNVAINLKTGLPSPAGNNNLVLNGASTFLGGLNAPGVDAPNDGKDLSAFWHSAVLP